MRVAFVLLIALLCVSCTHSRTVLLCNNTSVNLTVYVDDKATDISPGTSADVIVKGTQWIDFGIVAHQYDLSSVIPASRFRGVQDEKIHIQAENDGRLYVVPARSPFPVRPLPMQSGGSPLLPAQQVDRT